MATQQSMEEWREEMESRVAIGDLVSNYCHALDKRDEELFCSIWHPDATWATQGLEPNVGFDAILADYRSRPAGGDWQMRHYVTNHVITFEGAERARGKSDVYAAHVLADGTPRTIVATYNDIYERRDGEWRFVERVVPIHYFLLGATKISTQRADLPAEPR